MLCLGFGWWIGLTVAELVTVTMAVWLILVAALAALIWGSAWDADLDARLEGPVQTMLHEHVPTTPRRLALISGSAILVVCGVLTYRWLPLPSAISALAVLCSGVMAASWRVGMRCLEGLARPA